MRFKNNQRRFRTCEFLTKKYTRWFFKMSDIRSEYYDEDVSTENLILGPFSQNHLASCFCFIKSFVLSFWNHQFKVGRSIGYRVWVCYCE